MHRSVSHIVALAGLAGGCFSALGQVVNVAGSCDCYDAAGVENPTPRPIAQTYVNSIYPNQNTPPFDHASLNRALVHSFTNIPADITSATLTIRARPLDSSIDSAGNDSITLGVVNGAGTNWTDRRTWYFGSGNGGTSPVLFPSVPWFASNYPLSACGAQASVTIDNVTTIGGGNLLNLVKANGVLDIMVQDDTSVDCITLTYTRGCTQAPGQMTLWLPFDNRFGPQTSNIAGAGGGPGTLTGATPFQPTGKVAGARYFNGTSADRCDVASYPGIEIGTNDFSIDMWVKRDGTFSGVKVLADKRAGNGVGYEYYLYDASGSGNAVQGLQLATSTGFTNWNGAAATAVPNDGAWHHVAVTVHRTGANAAIQFYLDGDPQGGTYNPSARSASLTNFSQFSVGGSLMSSTGFKGWLDEVELFCRALSSAEVHELWEVGSAGKCKVRLRPTWEASICGNNFVLNTNCVVQNLLSAPATFQLSGAAATFSSAGCTGPNAGPFVFPGTVNNERTFPVGMSSFPVQITAAPTMTFGQRSCYQISGVETTSGFLAVTGQGRFVRNHWCISVLDGPMVQLDANTTRLKRFSVSHSQPTTTTLAYRISAAPANGSTLGAVPISLNNLGQGVPVTGSISVPAGQTSEVSVDIGMLARTIEEMPADVLFAMDLNSDGIIDDATETVASLRIEETVAVVPDDPCDSIDFNGDGLFPDTADIDDFLAVFAGNPCSNAPNCGDIDFNNDGLFPDTLDIDALLSVFAGGPCLR